MKQITLCITGGHLTPALAVIEEIRRQNINWNMLFIGRSHAFGGGGGPTQEERLIKAYAIPFHALFTGRQGFSLWKFPIGFFQSFFLLVSYRPAAVLSFGGYIALPVAIAAFLLKIPIITHEQTRGLGLANRIISRFARRVIFSNTSGVPLRRALFTPPEKPSFSIDSKFPILYVSGGSTGASSLNALVYPLIAELTKTYTVVHQVGSGDKSTHSTLRPKGRSMLRVDTERRFLLRAKARSLTPSNVSKAPVAVGRYVVAQYFDTQDVAWIYAHAALVIGRAGANTVAESAALGVPALFIPLPWSSGNEQMNNARVLEREGMAVVVKQEELSCGSLMSEIEKIMEHIGEYKKSAEKVAKVYPRDGAEKVVITIRSMLS